MADLRAPRGMSDLLPEDEAAWSLVTGAAARVARLFGYGRIETPIAEDARVFARTAGGESDIVSKEMYAFEDRGGGRLALRPEGTAAVCRAYLEHGMGSRPRPVRLWYLGPMFRYDRPQAGRYRQLWQFGAECIGDPSPAADAEAIELQHAVFAELGLGGVALRVNSIGTAETRRAYAEALRAHFRPHLGALSADSRRRFEGNVLRILDSKEDADHPAVMGAPSILGFLAPEDAAHFAGVRALLDAAGVAHEVDPRIVRGLDYYARTVWEFAPADGGQQSALSGGGRYDGLIELLGGPPTPGTGFAMGVERTLLALRERGALPAAAGDGGAAPDVATIPLGEAGPAAALRLAQALRAEGLAVRAGVPGRSLRAQLRGANAAGARWAAIVGDDEAARGVVQLKPLSGDAPQRETPAAEAASVVRGEA